MIKYSNAAATDFVDILANMNLATAGGTTCNGAPLEPAGRAIFNILSNCNVTVPQICDISRITNYTTQIATQINECDQPLDDYGTYYKVSYHKKNNLYCFVSECPVWPNLWKCPSKCVPRNDSCFNTYDIWQWGHTSWKPSNQWSSNCWNFTSVMPS